MTHRLTTPDSAKRLHLSPATLREWIKGWEENCLALTPRGRPTRDSDAELRRAAEAIFDLVGPGIGVPTLRFLFPSMAERELIDLIGKYREAHFDGRRTLVHALSWENPGAVWAMDYTAPPNVIEGKYKTILAVRDLATGRMLAAFPAEEGTAETTCHVLRALFREHGAPLVIKSDNGTHFIAAEVTALLAAFRILHLRSPFFTPSYNGAIEAGIGSLKIRTHYEAARHDRPGEWTIDDVEAARLRGNELGRPRGRARPTPDVAWAARSAITDDRRTALHVLVAQNELEQLNTLGYQQGAPVGAEVMRSVQRAAISRALCQLGVVEFRRRFVSLPINPGLSKKIA